MDEQLHSLLNSRFSMETFRPGQLDILRSVAQGRDTLAVMPTGGGKSLCYQLPSLLKPGITVVVSPLIALMKDQVSHLHRTGIAAGALYSGQDMEEKRKIFSEMHASSHYLLYVSPERVQHEGFITWIAKQKLTLFAIDESHCLSQWGPDFRTDYHKLNILRQLRPDTPILALTATATPPVLRDIEARLNLKNAAKHIYGFHRPNLFLQIVPCDTDEKILWLKQSIRTQIGEGRAIIYCGTRKQTHEIAVELKEEFSAVAHYHAGLAPESRDRIQKDFESGKVRILTATNAFGMGIDRPDVRLVVHYQMPSNIENYYQEIGRAGRDNKPATCLMLYARKDKGLQSYFIQNSDANDGNIQQRWKALNTFVQFLESEECRFAGILTYFKDTTRLKTCGHCDVCNPASTNFVTKPPRPQKVVVIKKTKSSSKKSKELSDDDDLDAKEQLRFEELREWRKKYADEHDIPAFVVFSNKTLKDLVIKNPSTLTELNEVYGFGEKKVEHLGPILLKVMSNLK